MPQKHGNKVKIPVLLTPEQYAKLEAMAKKDNRSLSNMVGILIEREPKR